MNINLNRIRIKRSRSRYQQEQKLKQIRRQQILRVLRQQWAFWNNLMIRSNATSLQRHTSKKKKLWNPKKRRWRNRFLLIMIGSTSNLSSKPMQNLSIMSASEGMCGMCPKMTSSLQIIWRALEWTRSPSSIAQIPALAFQPCSFSISSGKRISYHNVIHLGIWKRI